MRVEIFGRLRLSFPWFPLYSQPVASGTSGTCAAALSDTQSRIRISYADPLYTRIGHSYFPWQLLRSLHWLAFAAQYQSWCRFRSASLDWRELSGSAERLFPGGFALHVKQRFDELLARKNFNWTFFSRRLGERRIRVHTLCLPIASTVGEVIQSADQQCIVGLLAKMGKWIL